MNKRLKNKKPPMLRKKISINHITQSTSLTLNQKPDHPESHIENVIRGLIDKDRSMLEKMGENPPEPCKQMS